MPNVRPLNERKYQMSKHRFLQIYHFCLQYNEWKEELKFNDNIGKTAEKCKLIEQTALETDSDLYPYILKAVTNENVTFPYLLTMMEMPCGKNTYYERRKRFYWLLSRKL